MSPLETRHQELQRSTEEPAEVVLLRGTCGKHRRKERGRQKLHWKTREQAEVRPK